MEDARQDMEHMLSDFPEAQLQIKDRLPYNFLLAQIDPHFPESHPKHQV